MAIAGNGLYFIAAAQVTDLVTFYATASVVPIENEVDPIARLAVGLLGIGGVLILKCAALAGLLWAATRLRAAPDWVRLTGLSFAIGAGLSGAAANLVVLAVALR